MYVGIDLGTTYCVVSRINSSGKAEVIRNRFNRESTPSIIYFKNKDEYEVGDNAKRYQASGMPGTISFFKREMGNETFAFEVDGKKFSAEDLSTILLKHLIKEAEAVTGEKIESAVITCPAYFTEFQRRSTRKAGERCGIEVLRIINEPTAAAFYYGLNKEMDKTLMVFDLGGGTFDVTIGKVKNGDVEVLGTLGNHYLGGKNWDSALMNYVLKKYKEDYGEDLFARADIADAATVEIEDQKKTLTDLDKATIRIHGESGVGVYDITRKMFEDITSELVEATLSICNTLLNELKLDWKNMDEVLLVGGSTRMPMIINAVEKANGSRPSRAGSDRDMVVSLGAAIYANEIVLNSRRTGIYTTPKISDVTAHTLGALSVDYGRECYYNEFMIKRNSKIPATGRKIFGIDPGNMTHFIEVYTLQGESRIPLECVPLSKFKIEGFINNGNGVTIEVKYNYTPDGIVEVEAEHGKNPLKVTGEPLPDDLSWMGKPIMKAPPQPPKKKLEVVLAVDLSGSMAGSFKEVKRALHKFTDTIDGNIGMVGFADQEDVIRHITGNKGELHRIIDEIDNINFGDGTSGNPFNSSLKCFEIASSSLPLALTGEKKKVIVVLTDGQWFERDQAFIDADKCKKKKIDILAIGFATADHGFLKKISTVDEGALKTSVGGLEEAFQTIASVITNSMRG